MRTINLSVGYKRPIVAGLNLSLPMGVTALLGRNGAGKTTLIKTLTGSILPIMGDVILNGKSVRNYSKRELAKYVSLVSTDYHSAGGLRLKEFVALGRIPYMGRMGILSADDREKVHEAMNRVGISGKADEYVSRLSDGERQKGMLARVLVQETPIIIMDEPFSFLDVSSRLELYALIDNLSKEENKSVLFSTHEITEALRMVGNIWMFTIDGFAEGSPERLINEGMVDKLFPNKNIWFDSKSRDFRLGS